MKYIDFKYKEYLTYSKILKKNCIDFSKNTINLARKKFGKKFYCNDF